MHVLLQLQFLHCLLLASVLQSSTENMELLTSEFIMINAWLITMYHILNSTLPIHTVYWIVHWQHTDEPVSYIDPTHWQPCIAYVWSSTLMTLYRIIWINTLMTLCCIFILTDYTLTILYCILNSILRALYNNLPYTLTILYRTLNSTLTTSCYNIIALTILYCILNSTLRALYHNSPYTLTILYRIVNETCYNNIIDTHHSFTHCTCIDVEI